ncbi:BLOC-1-related complex subunit 6, partial [Trinorchestia longiramus]
QISALTVDCVETYRDTVCKTCDAVDANIKSMYQLMAKGEELSKAMKPAYALHSQMYP